MTDDPFKKLRDIRREERALTEDLEIVRDRLSVEVRALVNGVYGRRATLQEVADATEMSKSTAHAWMKRGSGDETAAKAKGK